MHVATRSKPSCCSRCVQTRTYAQFLSKRRLPHLTAEQNMARICALCAVASGNARLRNSLRNSVTGRRLFAKRPTAQYSRQDSSATTGGNELGIFDELSPRTASREVSMHLDSGDTTSSSGGHIRSAALMSAAHIDACALCDQNRQSTHDMHEELLSKMRSAGGAPAIISQWRVCVA
eukprot:SAG31_NODE_199_length_20573_cov_5.832129_3_plen_177_part_00